MSPDLPHAAFEAHLIDPGNTPLIGIEHGTGFLRVIMADDAESAWRPRLIPVKMPHQQGTLHQPFERRMPVRRGWENRMPADHIPFPNQDIKLFQRAYRFLREFGMLIDVHTPCRVCISAP